MLRNEWEFFYTGSKLAAAAAKQRDFRAERVSFYRGELERLMKEARESGIEITESVAAGVQNYASTRMVAPVLSIRDDLQTKIIECHQKVQEHSQAARQYEGWYQVLMANPDATLKLNHDDWLYFFGQ